MVELIIDDPPWPVAQLTAALMGSWPPGPLWWHGPQGASAEEDPMEPWYQHSEQPGLPETERPIPANLPE